MKLPRLAWIAPVFLLHVGTASAHSFGRTYNLPIPFWLYIYGAAAALLLSFLVIGYFTTASAPRRAAGYLELPWINPQHVIIRTLRVFSVALLALIILTGLVGTQFAYQNINMTFFWVIFVLGFTYLIAFVGNFFAPVNPWQVLAEWLGRVGLSMEGRVRYPDALGYYPALLFYMAFIWLELFGHASPRSLSIALIVYSLINLAGAWVWGIKAWFCHCEFFGVFFSLIAKVAPVETVVADGKTRLRFRPAFAGLLDDQSKDKAGHFSLLLFVLFMLSSTAFDGLHDTAPWMRGFWVHIRGLLMPMLGTNIVETYPTLKRLFAGYQYLGLVLSPFFYLMIYLGFIAMTKWVVKSQMSLRELALRFAFPLIPIALVYSISHYFTLLIMQGPQILRLSSDPFGFGWNIFGTVGWLSRPTVAGMGFVWHAQVVLILAGHIASVYVAHLEALALFPSRRQAILSQLPMLLLMVAYTTIGLWILAQPITSGQPLG